MLKPSQRLSLARPAKLVFAPMPSISETPQQRADRWLAAWQRLAGIPPARRAAIVAATEGALDDR